MRDFETNAQLQRLNGRNARSMIEWSILKQMPRRESPLQSEMLQGTLDMLVLRTLVLGPAHGHTIAHAIERGSEDVLQVEHGSLYPALHRLEDRGWIASFWGSSENNRKAKYYRLTPAGRKQLSVQTTRWEQVVRAIGRILTPTTE
jgi:PadR family transcriptional regulator